MKNFAIYKELQCPMTRTMFAKEVLTERLNTFSTNREASSFFTVQDKEQSFRQYLSNNNYLPISNLQRIKQYTNE